MDLDLIPELNEDGMINLVGEDVGVVIGRYGETLKALEYLTNLACHDDMSTRRVRFDCGGYRLRREQTLTRLAESIARESLRKGTPVSLEPMSSWERRLVHLALKDNKEVETKSIGEEPSRRVLVCPVGQTDRDKKRPSQRTFRGR
jgi:spoIIIJ-associated protein